jgi:gliding motility-associated protein GldC
MAVSTITIDVHLDENKVPEHIMWNASASTADAQQKAKAMMLAFWDGAEKNALRIDLWSKEMMVDEMADFYYQTFITMADSFARATGQHQLSEELKTFARDFNQKFRETQLKENKV